MRTRSPTRCFSLCRLLDFSSPLRPARSERGASCSKTPTTSRAATSRAWRSTRWASCAPGSTSGRLPITEGTAIWSALPLKDGSLAARHRQRGQAARVQGAKVTVLAETKALVDHLARRGVGRHGRARHAAGRQGDEVRARQAERSGDAQRAPSTSGRSPSTRRPTPSSPRPVPRASSSASPRTGPRRSTSTPRSST